MEILDIHTRRHAGFRKVSILGGSALRRDMSSAAVQNEEEHVEEAIESTRIPGSRAQPRVIVVDGGSKDSTIKIALRCKDVHVLKVDHGRGAQLNAGATLASSPWLLFLHADCTLPQDYFSQICAATQPRQRSVLDRCLHVRGDAQWGCFATIATSDRRLATVQWGVQARTRFLGVPYGDQGLFCRRSTFSQVRAHPPVGVALAVIVPCSCHLLALPKVVSSYCAEHSTLPLH